MPSPVRKWLDIQPEEVGIFLWTAMLFFLMRNSDLIFDNFVETVFLKRFGVKYLPMVYMANSVVTFFSMGALMGLLMRLPSGRLLRNMLVCFGLTLASLRVVVGMEVNFIYPVLFLLRSQVEALNNLVFWNMANDLFNTRQSKRLFPLISAGGVLGAILASFSTPPLARAIGLDNFMLTYALLCFMAAGVVWRISRLFPTLSLNDRREAKGQKRPSLAEELKNVWPLIRTSTLVMIMVLITFLPNVMIPIMNYQFNFAVNAAFKSEGGMVNFFGWFRGGLYIISFIILMFVGKIYGRWGLPVALMFHPANYMLAFLSLLLRFDIFSAMYARISTNVLRDTINNPAREVLMGLFPPQNRAVMKTFLRGTVVRIGIILGSAATMLCQGLIHPRYLSIVGLVFGGCWVVTSIWLKKAYPTILLDLISKDTVDIKSLERSDLEDLFQDRHAQAQLAGACRQAAGAECVWYAEMMRGRAVEGLDQILLEILPGKDREAVLGLLPLISPQAGARALEVFAGLAEAADPELCLALAEAAARLPGAEAQAFLRRLLEPRFDLSTQAQAVIGLYPSDHQEMARRITAWLDSDSPQERLAGVRAAGGSGQSAFLPRLRDLLASESDVTLVGRVLVALERLGDPELRDMVLSRLAADPEGLPHELLEAFAVADEPSARAFIRLLGHGSQSLRDLALRKLGQASELDSALLIESLSTPNRQVREGLFQLMESLKISDREIMNFAHNQLARAYFYLMEERAVHRLLEPCPASDLLRQHFLEMTQTRVQTILRVLETQDTSGSMRVVLRGLSSADKRLRANAVEALETILGRNLSRAMVPLLEQSDPAALMSAGLGHFKFRQPLDDRQQLNEHLLNRRNWVTLALFLECLAQGNDQASYAKGLELLGQFDDPVVRERVTRLVIARQAPTGGEITAMAEATTSLSEKILLLKGMEMLAGLSVSELAAVAAVSEEVSVAPGEVIIGEGEIGDSMYFVVAGRAQVSKIAEAGCQIELATLTPGEYFGEMALFDNLERSATVKALETTKLLMLHRREFNEVVREYPQVALQICTDLSRRVRTLQGKIQALQACEWPGPPQPS
ncbi:MAG: Npt1/Npt2 family nucleotide transporter [Pseudomonadota bacterium]